MAQLSPSLGSDREEAQILPRIYSPPTGWFSLCNNGHWVVISKVAVDSHLQVFYFSLFLKGLGQGADIGRWDDTMSHPVTSGIFLLLTKKAPGATSSRQQAAGWRKK